MGSVLLYSTNVYLKYLIQKEYRSDVHYVWCSEYFNSATAPAYSMSSLVPPTSNPSDIYRDLSQAVARGDSHNAKIIEQKASLLKLAAEWKAVGSITQDQWDEIAFNVQNGPMQYWRPLLYVIPAESVVARVQTVPVAKRAGAGREFIIPDLAGREFHVIEF